MREDEPFFCPDCKLRIKKRKPDGLDIENVIGDLEATPGTRRKRYVNTFSA
jgi:hypothetical protein